MKSEGEAAQGKSTMTMSIGKEQRGRISRNGNI